jgi:hypothetical protein
MLHLVGIHLVRCFDVARVGNQQPLHQLRWIWIFFKVRFSMQIPICYNAKAFVCIII